MSSLDHPIRPCADADFDAMNAVINAAATAYAGVIPAAQLPLIIQDKTFVPDAATLAAYAYDGTWAAQRPAVVLHPRTTAQVIAILRLADQARIPIVPRGAATGLAGGSVPIAGSWWR